MCDEDVHPQGRVLLPWYLFYLRQKNRTPNSSVSWLIRRRSFSFPRCLLMTLVISEMSCRTSLVTAKGVGHTARDCFWLSLTFQHSAPHKPQMSFSIQSYSPFSEERWLEGWGWGGGWGVAGESWLIHKACEGYRLFYDVPLSLESRSLTGTWIQI